MRDIIIKWGTVPWFIWFQISPFSFLGCIKSATSSEGFYEIARGIFKSLVPLQSRKWTDQTRLKWYFTNFTIWIMFWTSRPIATWMPGTSPRHPTSWKWSSESIWNKPQAIGDWPVIGGRYLLHRVHRLLNLGENHRPYGAWSDECF